MGKTEIFTFYCGRDGTSNMCKAASTVPGMSKCSISVAADTCCGLNFPGKLSWLWTISSMELKTLSLPYVRLLYMSVQTHLSSIHVNFIGAWQFHAVLSFSFFSISLHLFRLYIFFCLIFTKCWNNLQVVAAASLIWTVIDHLFWEAIHQQQLTRTWSRVGVGGGPKVTLLGSLTTCCDSFWLMLWKFLLIASLFQGSVDLLSLSRFLILAENQHSQLLKSHANGNINWAPIVYWALHSRVKHK